LCQQVAPVVVSMNETGGERGRFLEERRVPEVKVRINEYLGVRQRWEGRNTYQQIALHRKSIGHTAQKGRMQTSQKSGCRLAESSVFAIKRYTRDKGKESAKLIVVVEEGGSIQRWKRSYHL